MSAVGWMVLLLASLASRQVELPMVIALRPATSDYSQRMAADVALAKHLAPAWFLPLAMLAYTVELLLAFAEIALHVAAVLTCPAAIVLRPLTIAALVPVLAAGTEVHVALDVLNLGHTFFAGSVCSSMSVGANHQF